MSISRFSAHFHGMRLGALALAALLSGASHAADVTLGQSFSMMWMGDAGAVVPAQGYTDATIGVAFDDSVLRLDGVAAGSALGLNPALSVQSAAGGFDISGWGIYPGYITYVTQGGQQTNPLLVGSDIFYANFTVLSVPAAGYTPVFLIDATAANAGSLPDTYLRFGAQASTLTVAVPEPATVASMLAGLALLGGVLRQRRRAEAAAE